MPSQLERTSAILGEYMLKGWTLTELHCDTCRATPLMREPPAEARRAGRTDRIQFCAQCDGGPMGAAGGHGSGSGAAAAAVAAATPPTQSIPAMEVISPLDPNPPISRSTSINTTSAAGASLAALAGGVDVSSPRSTSPSLSRTASASSLRNQPPSAPPTRPLPAAPESTSSPGASTARSGPIAVAVANAAAEADTDPTRSDRIAQQIASALERGFSLLGDNCPDAASCPGVPLVGYPRRADGSADGRRMCVACGGGWVDAARLDGLRIMGAGAGGAGAALAPVSGARARTGTGAGVIEQDGAEHGATTDAVNDGDGDERMRTIMAMYAAGSAHNAALAPPAQVGPLVSSSTNPGDVAFTSGTAHAPTFSETHAERAPPAQRASTQLTTTLPAPASSHTRTAPAGPIDDALGATSNALAQTLTHLAATLSARTAADADHIGSDGLSPGQGPGPGPGYYVDVKLHTEALRDVLDVIERVGRVERAREIRREGGGRDRL